MSLLPNDFDTTLDISRLPDSSMLGHDELQLSNKDISGVQTKTPSEIQKEKDQKRKEEEKAAADRKQKEIERIRREEEMARKHKQQKWILISMGIIAALIVAGVILYFLLRKKKTPALESYTIQPARPATIGYASIQ